MRDEEPIHDLYRQINDRCQRGHWDEAQTACQTLTQLAPQDGVAWYCFGAVALERGAAAEGVAALQKAVSLSPHTAQYWREWAAALQKFGRWQEAADACRRALQHHPDEPALWRTLASAEAAAGHWNESISAYERCRQLAPDQDDVVVEYCDALTRVGKANESSTLLKPLLDRRPDILSAWIVLCTASLLLKRWSDAVAACDSALRIDPHNQQTFMLLGIALARQWRLSQAESVVRQLLDRQPELADAWSFLAGLLRMQARSAEAVPALEQAVKLSQDPRYESELLMTQQYVPGQTRQSLQQKHLDWAAHHARNVIPIIPATVTRGEAPDSLKIGFVSGDFGLQATSYLALPLMESLDQRRCSIFCYSDRTEPDDAVTTRFRAAATAWRDVGGWRTSSLIDQIQSDQIDVLIDLMGHTGHRLLAFAARPAPLQVTWLGYVGTTGLTAIDFLLADRFHVRPGEEDGYVERVLRMPHDYACYTPIFDAPAPAAPPALQRGFVTFGCFNNPSKYSPQTFDAWAAILRRVPTARLHLKYGGLEHPPLQERLRSQFAQRGITAERISFEGWTPATELMASYHQIDLALDTQPYSGGVTTCEALWMGVPVIAYAGETFCGRHAVSHLANAGFAQFVAADAAEYVELAVQWALRLSELSALRTTMRDQMRHSPLCDAPRFARDFLDLLIRAWISGAG